MLPLLLVVSVLLSSDPDPSFSGFSRSVVVSSEAGGLTGLALIGGVSRRGLVTSGLGRGLGLALGTGFLGRPVGRGGLG